MLSGAIANNDTAALFDYLIDVLSYQGISDGVAFSYMERHGRVTWASLKRGVARKPSCPKLTDFWSFEGCGYNKTRRTCSQMGHIERCPLPRFRLRNGRLNQTAFALYFFIRDIAVGDFVGWIDTQLQVAAPGDQKDDRASLRESLIGPLRQVYGISDKVLSMSLSSILMAAPRTKPLWFEVGSSIVVVDTLTHNALTRMGVLWRLDGKHRYGVACYRDNGCHDILQRIALRIDARQFNAQYPKTFPRFVQLATWNFCAQQGHNVCNGNNIADQARCNNVTCQLFRRCDRKRLHMTVLNKLETEIVSPALPSSGIAKPKETDMATKKAAGSKTVKSKKAKPTLTTKAKATPNNRKLVDPDAPVFVLFGRDENEKPRAARLPGFNPDLVHRAALIMGYRAVETTVGESEAILTRLPVGRIFADGKALAPPVSAETYEMIAKATGGDLGKISTTLPKSWEEITPGQLVLAEQSATDGWWIAVVTEREGDQVKFKWRDFPQEESIVRHIDALALISPATPS